MDNIEEILVRSLPEEKYLRNFFKDRDVIETYMYMYLLNQVTFCEEMVQVLICWYYSRALILYFGVKLHIAFDWPEKRYMYMYVQAKSLCGKSS